MRCLLTAIAILMASCTSLKQGEHPRCERLNTDETIEHASGLTHGYDLELRWFKERLSQEEAKSYLWETCFGYTEQHKEDYSDYHYNKYKQQCQEWLDESWAPLEGQMREGDELWFYSTPDDMWGALAGQEGLALLRGCQLLARIITVQS